MIIRREESRASQLRGDVQHSAGGKLLNQTRSNSVRQATPIVDYNLAKLVSAAATVYLRPGIACQTLLQGEAVDILNTGLEN